MLETPSDPDMVVDHKNGDDYDNTDENLRWATFAQNCWNRKINKNKVSSTFKGVFYRKNRSHWFALVCVSGQKIYLGSFKTELEAAIEYDKAIIYYHGEFAKTNFPIENYLSSCSLS